MWVSGGRPMAEPGSFESSYSATTAFTNSSSLSARDGSVGSSQ